MIIDILTGQVQAGKTTLLRKITFELKKRNFSIGGFLSLSVHDDNEVTGYDLFDLKEETRYPFLRKQGDKDWEKIGPYFFIPEALEQAKRIIFAAEHMDICFVDEVGPYELEGKGLWPALLAALKYPFPRLFLTVRAKLCDAFLEKLGQNADRIFDVADSDVQSAIMDHLEQKLINS